MIEQTCIVEADVVWAVSNMFVSLVGWLNQKGSQSMHVSAAFAALCAGAYMVMARHSALLSPEG